jgi:hypothetical protein
MRDRASLPADLSLNARAGTLEDESASPRAATGKNSTGNLNNNMVVTM